MSTNINTIRDLAERDYKWGFVTEVEEERVPRGLNEDIIRLISAKKNEPEFMLQWRMKAYKYWASLAESEAEPKWANIKYGPIDYQDIVYYSAPKQKAKLNSLDELDFEPPSGWVCFTWPAKGSSSVLLTSSCTAPRTGSIRTTTRT